MSEISMRGRKALVTGGSRGIGRAVALRLAGAGASVVACYAHDSEEAATLAHELETSGGRAVRADVSNEADVAGLADICRNTLGTLDILVNNAGTMSCVPYAELKVPEWHRILSVNLTGVHLVCQAALPLLSDGASIVNISSALALVGMPARAHYAAAKAGVLGLSRSLAKELGPRGIRVNTISPGIIETDLASQLTPEQKSQYTRLSALGRLGRPEDIADVVLFLASDLARFVNGVNLPVDGGI